MTAPDTRTSGLSVRRLSKSYGDHIAIEDVSLNVPLQSVLAVIGPSGAGKTTLLRCIAGLEQPDKGRVLFHDSAKGGSGDERTATRKPRELKEVGMVFQGLNLWPHMTVLENVMYGLLKVKHMNRETARNTATQALESIGLVHKVNSYPDSLSGGEAQRVAIVRALVMRPLLLLLDEITSALDVERTWEVLDLVQRLAQEGITMVIVTHELGFARNVSTQLAFLDNGKLVESGLTEEIFRSPKSLRTKQFLSRGVV